MVSWGSFLLGLGLGAMAVEAFFSSPAISFLTAEETRKIIGEDIDGFIASLTPSDLSARHALSVRDYMHSSMQSVLNYTPQQEKRIRRLVDAIKYSNVPLEKYGMDPSKFRAMPWKFALARYEDEYPHTRGDVIFLSPNVLTKTDLQLQSTLLHEQIHVYQKKHPQDVRAFLELMGYQEVGRRSMDPLLRANPDLDGIVYQDRQGNISGLQYRSKTPASIDDVVGDAQNEHPLEQIAYIVSRDR